tara:strand:+ start:176 stop:619 length:444 start_codon:yes stop_codon:yes gene_type:complete
MKAKNIEENRTKFTTSTDLRIRFNEIDALGIVWHGHYIKYFEDAREAFGKEHNISYLDQKNNGFASPIIKLICEHKLPLRYEDFATIEATYIDSPAVKMIFEYKIINSQGKLVCEGKTVQVFVDFNGVLCLTYPPFFETWKRKKGLL